MINMLVQQHHFIVFKKWTRTSLNPWFFVFQSDCLWKIKSCNSNPTQNYLFSKLFICQYQVLVWHAGSLVSACEFLAVACGIWFPDWGSTWAPCIGSTESSPLDHQGNPEETASNMYSWKWMSLFYSWWTKQVKLYSYIHVWNMFGHKYIFSSRGGGGQ